MTAYEASLGSVTLTINSGEGELSVTMISGHRSSEALLARDRIRNARVLSIRCDEGIFLFLMGAEGMRTKLSSRFTTLVTIPLTAAGSIDPSLCWAFAFLPRKLLRLRYTAEFELGGKIAHKEKIWLWGNDSYRGPFAGLQFRYPFLRRPRRGFDEFRVDHNKT